MSGVKIFMRMAAYSATLPTIDTVGVFIISYSYFSMTNLSSVVISLIARDRDLRMSSLTLLKFWL